jgi:hypothetical protein
MGLAERGGVIRMGISGYVRSAEVQRALEVINTLVGN